MSFGVSKFLNVARTSARVADLETSANLERAKLPVLAVDDDVPVDSADHAFGRFLLVLVDQGLESLAGDVGQAGLGAPPSAGVFSW